LFGISQMTSSEHIPIQAIPQDGDALPHTIVLFIIPQNDQIHCLRNIVYIVKSKKKRKNGRRSTARYRSVLSFRLNKEVLPPSPVESSHRCEARQPYAIIAKSDPGRFRGFTSVFCLLPSCPMNHLASLTY
jgi:hypothetical protein